MDLPKSLRCISCDKDVEFDHKGEVDNCIPSINSGLWCRARGNYGSSIYDPMDSYGDEFLAFILCDECAVKKQDNIIHAKLKAKLVEYDSTTLRGMMES